MTKRERVFIRNVISLHGFSFGIFCQSGTISEMRLATGYYILSYHCKVRNVPIILWESSALVSLSIFSKPFGDPPVASVSAHRLLSVICIHYLSVSE